MDLVKSVEDRLCIGKQRYGHGVVVPCNASKNWNNELVEELLDACVYAAADVLRRRGVENDEDNSEILKLILERTTAKYEYNVVDREDTHVLDLCIFVANAVMSKK
jgi:hypothetical protein